MILYVYILSDFRKPCEGFFYICNSNVVFTFALNFFLRLQRRVFVTFANAFLGFATLFLRLQALEIVPSLGAGSKSLTLKSAVSLSSGSPGPPNSRFAQLGWPDFPSPDRLNLMVFFYVCTEGFFSRLRTFFRVYNALFTFAARVFLRFFDQTTL